MSEIRIANRYAKSILDLAVDTNQLAQVAEDMDYLNQAFQSRELYNLIKSPIINKGKKLDIFSKLFSSKLSDLTQLFLERVIKKGRESIIPEMIKSFDSLYKEKLGITSVQLTIASNLSETTLNQIKVQISNLVGQDRQIDLDIQQNANLIGGFILNYEDKKYDASIRHQLDNIRKTFSA